MYLAGTEPPLVIYCIKNGDSTGDYTQVILDKRDRVSWEKVRWCWCAAREACRKRACSLARTCPLCHSRSPLPFLCTP